MADDNESCDLAIVWSEACREFARTAGRDAVRAWLDQARVERRDGGQICLVLASDFHRAHLEEKYGRDLRAMWLKHDPLRRHLTFVARRAVRTEPAKSSLRPAPVNRLTPSAPLKEVTRGRIAGQTFDRMVVGAFNELAVAAVKRAVLNGGGAFNPLVINAPFGYGKTHLLNAARRLSETQGEAGLLLRAEEFIDQYLSAVRAGPDEARGLAAFRARLKSVSLLLIDDLHVLAKKSLRSTQIELLHAMMALVDAGVQVVVTLDRPEDAVPELDEHVKSFLKGGLSCDIGPMSTEDARAILRRELEDFQKECPGARADDAVLDLIAQASAASPRDVIGAFNKVMARTALMNRSVTLGSAQDALRDALRRPRRLTVESIQKQVANHYGLSMPELLSKRRTKNIVRPRQIAMYLSKKLTTRSLPDIGRRFGGKDHTTVLHAVRKIEDLMASDPTFADEVRGLRSDLDSPESN
ncbi:MAG: chromosomal replication initiator protein DnaA [Maricaulaceae bacterium]